MKIIYFLLKDLEERINGNPKVGFYYYKNSFCLRVSWLRPSLNWEYQFSILDVIRMGDEETKTFLEFLIKKANREYRKTIEFAIKEMKSNF